MKMLVAQDSDQILGITVFGFRAERTDGGYSDRDVRAASLYETTQNGFNSSDDGRGDWAASGQVKD